MQRILQTLSLSFSDYTLQPLQTSFFFTLKHCKPIPFFFTFFLSDWNAATNAFRSCQWRDNFGSANTNGDIRMATRESACSANTNGDTSPVSFRSAFGNGGTHGYRWWQWRYMLAASKNGGINVKIRPPLQLVSKQTQFRKLFLKKTLYSKFADL